MSKNPPLLVIEDETAVMSFLRAALERNGYEIVTASSGAEGLKLLETGSYVGVISDMRTPGGITGADVHAWIRAHRPELLHRILFITGDTVNQETMAILQKTGAPCIEKPFRVAQLLKSVELLLAGNRA
ncbi:MAG: response regulator [Acidobacteria bacterium]|nr:response regulator [Acidobacteriota bacterium]MBV9144637.1 response regulator [Acidobacteriota bacterium]MBV9436398.1 response regulator [Acidobacteriota bacterium]